MIARLIYEQAYGFLRSERGYVSSWMIENILEGLDPDDYPVALHAIANAVKSLRERGRHDPLETSLRVRLLDDIPF